MNKKVFILSIIISILVTSCGNPVANFKGNWRFDGIHESDGIKQGYEYVLWIDFENSKVGRDGFDNALGVIRSVFADEENIITCTAKIIEANVDGDTAEIKYEHLETGEIWKATLTFNPQDSTIRWEKGGLYKTGLWSRKEKLATDADVYLYLEPEETVLKKVSDKVNYIQLDDSDIVAGLPDRAYYIQKAYSIDESGDWTESMQLRCLYDKDEDIRILFNDGKSLWDEDLGTHISEAWALPDNSGIMLITWSGGTASQSSGLYRVGADNYLEKIDYVEGLGTNPMAGFTQEEIDFHSDDVISSTPGITKYDDKVKVYDPDKMETRYYDLAGNRK